MDHCSSHCQTTEQEPRNDYILPGAFGFSLMLLSWFKLLPSALEGRFIWPVIGIISLILLVKVGGHFFTGAIAALKQKKANMDTLVALGTGTAWLYSMSVALFPTHFPLEAQHFYFETAMIVITFISLGTTLESKAKKNTTDSIKKLIGLQPKTARVIRDNKDVDINISDIKNGDLIRVRPGETIAVDGVVTESETYINESMITGESLPVKKTINDMVIGGTLNTNGSIVIKAIHTGENMVLSQIVSAVKKAQQSKPKIGKLTDKIAGVFVPIVVIIAIITAATWLSLGVEQHSTHALITTLSVLLIACPCAVGLATPISITRGIGNAATKGILIQNGNALQQSSNITTVVFDKTGTLTSGQPILATTHPLNDWDKESLLEYAASVEKGAEHPWAIAIVNAAEKESLSLKAVENFTAISGLGVSATLNSKSVVIGNATFLLKKNIDYSVAKPFVKKIANQGSSPILIAIDNVIAGVFSISDPIKENSIEIIKRLHNQKIKVVMITGDNELTAKHVAKQLNIDQVFSNIRPEDKATKIKELQTQGEIVAMVGDGINDAPALTQADVGFAIGTGTDIAIESADITLMAGDLSRITESIQLSKTVMKNIKQNLFGAFIYNTLSIPLAAGMLYFWTGWLLNPMVAGAAMAASSLTVVLNSARLK